MKDTIVIDSLLPKDLRQLIKDMQLELDKKEQSKSIIATVVSNEKKDNCCPCCHSKNIVKDGKYKGRQKFKCKECGKKFNSLTNTPFHHTRLNYGQIEKLYQCLVDKMSIRKTSMIVGISTKTAFTYRFKIISCLKYFREENKLSGDMELDEYYLSINLKGTKKENMPRFSKPRQTNGTGKRGINNHKVCVVSGIDENDNMYFEIAGNGNVTSKMIKDTIAKKIKDPNKVITDSKSSYESVAMENQWDLKQVKAKCYVDDEGNNLANINSLHSELTRFLSKFHGVSTKHLQEYLDWFVFYKNQNYTVDYLKQEEDFEKKTIIKYTSIKYSNVCDNYSIFNFNEIYSDYNCHPSKSTT